MSTVGTIEVIASIDTSGYKSGAKKIDSINKGIENDTDSTTSKNNKSWLKQGAVMGAVAGVASSVFSKAMSVISDSVGDAVKRVDTLNNFPKIMTNLGYSAGEAKTELGRLEKGVLGLPTSLDQIALSMQRLTPSSKSISYATDLALAMNNAILSGGSSMDSQRAATEQLTQAFSRGKFELEEFKSLQVAMPGQLAQVAKFLGITSGNTQELYAKLKDGTISMDTFKDAMITMSKEGGAGFASFETQAKNSSAGIQTGIANMRTSISRGIAGILGVIGQANISNFITGVGTAFENTTKVISGVFSFLVDLFKNNEVAANGLKVALIGLAIVIGVSLVAALWSAVGAIVAASVASAPLLLAALGIAAAGLFIKSNWEKIKGALSPLISIFDKIKTAVQPLMDIIKSLGDFIGGQLASSFESIKSIVASAAESFKPLIEVFKEFWEKHGSKVITVVKVLAAVIGALALYALAPLLVGFGLFLVGLKIVSSILSFVAKHFEVVKKVVLGLLAVALSPLILGIGILIVAFNVVKVAVGALITVIKTIINVFMTLWGGIMAGLKWVWDFITMIASLIWSVISPIVTLWLKIWEMVITIVRTAISVILAIIITIVSFLWNNVISPIIGFFWQGLTTIWNVVSTVFSWIFGLIGSIVGWIWSNVLSPILGFFKSIFDSIKNVISGAWQFIKDKFSAAVDFVGGVIGRIGGFFSGVWDGVKSGVTGAMDVVKNGVKGAVNWIIDKINTVVRGVNSVAGKVPGVPTIPEIPKLAKGGIVMPTPGGTIAQIAEAGEAEAVIPLSKLDAIISGGGGSGSGGSKITQYNTIYTELDMNVVNRKLTWELGRA